MLHGCGTINFWGFSPAFEFKPDNHRNILLMGAGDLRHVLAMLYHRLSQKEQDTPSPIHVYVLEARLELYARMILQLYIISRETSELSLSEKVESFLEIHGDLLIRAASREFIQKCGAELVRIITDPSKMSAVLPFVDVSLLKYKEVDYLENIFKFWLEDKKKPIQLDPKFYWDIRLRQLLGTRYDSQKGAFDWDYNMRLTERNNKVSKVMSPGDYCRWRSNGVAFELREADYVEPNRTLITPTVLKDRAGDKTVRYGYWGDTVNSPYLSYILPVEDEDTIESTVVDKVGPGERPYTANVATTATEQYLLKVIYAITTGNTNFNPEEQTTQSSDINITEGSVINRLSQLVHIHFLPINGVNDLPRKSQFSQLFDATFISVSIFHMLNQQFCATTLRNGSRIVAETGRNLVELTNDQAKKLDEVIVERISSFGGHLDNAKQQKGEQKQQPGNDVYRSFLIFTYETPADAQQQDEAVNKDGDAAAAAGINTFVSDSLGDQK